MKASDPNLEHLHAIEKHIKSATDLTRQLLGTARGGKYNPKPTDLNDLVKGSASMFGRTRKEITIKTDLNALPVIAEVDKQQLEQVLLNMYVNSWQAMPHGGDLFIKTSLKSIDDTFYENYKIPAGNYAKISITDTGIGMDDSVCHQIFDPFFTTKEKERGTGLGLASAYGIIKNHDGFINVYSEIGHGTTFTIYLPLSDRQPLEDEPQNSSILKGAETILLVDDEELILEVGKSMLSEIGYEVITCKGGIQAIDALLSEQYRIDMVLLDLIMPGMDGNATFDKIREISPNMPVILSSGYSINDLATGIMNKGCNGFIQKPFNLSELSQKIRLVLDRN
jgi:CheY-like chemotaxis protein